MNNNKRTVSPQKNFELSTNANEEFRKIEKYPYFEISKNGIVRKIKDQSIVETFLHAKTSKPTVSLYCYYPDEYITCKIAVDKILSKVWAD